MAKKVQNSIQDDALAHADALRFSQICLDYVARGVHLEDGIGTLSEKRMHAILKHYVCADESCYEIRVKDALGQSDTKGNGYVADVLRGSNIWEIQTGSMYPMRAKIAWYMQHTPFVVTVVVPVPYKKHINWIDPATGTVQKRSTRPHTTKPSSVIGELFWLREHLSNPRLRFELLLLEVEEYRLLDGYGKEKKARASRYEKIPTALCGTVVLEKREDYLQFLPETLPDTMTAKQYAAATGIRGRDTYYALRALTGAGLLIEGDKIGRAQSWVRTDQA